NEQNYAGSVTWHDRVNELLLPTLTRMLVLASTQEESDAIDRAAEANLALLRATAAARGETAKEYITARYGKGITEGDVRRAAQLYARASLGADYLAGKVYTHEEREAIFAADPNTFLLCDYIAYSVEADYTDISTPDEMREAYIKAEARAKEIAEAKGENGFISAVTKDLKEKYPNLSTAELQRKIADLYVYHSPKKTAGIAATWAADPARKVGDIAMLGETGDYTVVYCLTPAAKRVDLTAEVWQIFFPFADYADTTATYEAARAKKSALVGLAAYENEPTAVLLPAAHRGNVEMAIGNWLYGARSAGDTVIAEGKDGYYLLCYADLSPYTVWEWQAISALQEADYAAWLAETPVKTRKVPKLPEAAMTRSTQ
ncbi:MAG: hypothetical protein IJ012_03470, partial [Clostridia bacterium]|nr:hypothetical protein [Clostridia bacterium]